MFYILASLACAVPAALGPLMPFLRSELHLNYEIASLHFGLFSLGIVIGGLTGDQVIAKLGRDKSLWFALGCNGTGLLALVFGSVAAVTIAGACLAGFANNTLYQALQGVIADRLKGHRTAAIMECEVGAMLCGTVSPILVSLFARTALGWRGAVVTIFLGFAACAILFRAEVNGAAGKVNEASAENGRLPLAFWAYAAIIFLSCASEWSLAFWGPDFLQQHLSMSKADAAAALGYFFVAMLTGRFAGSRLHRRIPVGTLLRASAFFSVSGFLTFWLGGTPLLATTGLFFAGLGIANMFPLSFSSGIGTAPGASRLAIARLCLMAGLATLVVPLALGFVANMSNIFFAYGIIAIILVCCAATILSISRK